MQLICQKGLEGWRKGNVLFLLVDAKKFRKMTWWLIRRLEIDKFEHFFFHQFRNMTPPVEDSLTKLDLATPKGKEGRTVAAVTFTNSVNLHAINLGFIPGSAAKCRRIVWSIWGYVCTAHDRHCTSSSSSWLGLLVAINQGPEPYSAADRQTQRRKKPYGTVRSGAKQIRGRLASIISRETSTSSAFFFGFVFLQS